MKFLLAPIIGLAGFASIISAGFAVAWALGWVILWGPSNGPGVDAD
jgi:hypothetical protein